MWKISWSSFTSQFGAFLGGVGGHTFSYLFGVDNFRGCISDVFYNNINILKRAREKSNHVETEKISWNCAPEFDAEIHETIRFYIFGGLNLGTNKLSYCSASWMTWRDLPFIKSRTTRWKQERVTHGRSIFVQTKNTVHFCKKNRFKWISSFENDDFISRYNLESSPRYDYMALEIIDSRLRLLVGKGSNAVELVPDKVIDSLFLDLN